MDLVNRVMTGLFDVVMTPFELLGPEVALILVSGLFGILALIVFKHISWQAGIKATKDKIKGHMIAIRLYQDDLVIVAKSVCAVLLRNLQYLGLNFGPILPLFIPFALVLAQFVVRYAYAPLPVTGEPVAASMLSGEGTMITVTLKSGREAEAGELAVRFPEGIQPITPLVRSGIEGKAFVEVVAVAPVRGDIEVTVGGQLVGTKEIVAGSDPPRRLQPKRTASALTGWMFPAERMIPSDSPLKSIEFAYPDRDLAFLPGGEIGIVLVFFLASILFGVAVLKPLKIQI